MLTHPSSTRLLTTIVVFERELDEVQAWPFLRQYLLAAAGRDGIARGRGFLLDHVLIYDNSSHPCAQPSEHLPGCIYVHNAGNGGTAAAYEHACTIAREIGIDWLLLLDQDTLLPGGFLEAAGVALLASSPRPCALVPWVFHGDSVVSPARITDAGTIVPLQYESSPPRVHELTAIASGSIFHVPALTAHMPLPRGLWLDYVDHWIFFQMRTSALPVVVFHSLVQHDLSVRTLESLNLNRLISILNGEAIFMTLLGGWARFVYPFRLVGRLFHYALIRPTLAISTIRWIIHRLKGCM